MLRLSTVISLWVEIRIQLNKTLLTEAVSLYLFTLVFFEATRNISLVKQHCIISFDIFLYFSV